MEQRPIIRLLKITESEPLTTDLFPKYHTHLICHSGKISFKFNGQPMACARGEFLFWFADSNVSSLTFSKRLKATVLLVEKNFLNQNIPDQAWSISAILHSRVHPVKQVDESDRVIIIKNFRLIHDLFLRQGHRFYDEVLSLQMRILIFEMWNIFANEYERRKHTLQTGTLYERFMLMAREKCVTEREVQFYSDKLNITAKYLNHISKVNSGVTASEWIQRFSKEHIVLLLQNRNLNISEIADEMNFSSRSFFTRYVKKLLGVTPKEYRERLE